MNLIYIFQLKINQPYLIGNKVLRQGKIMKLFTYLTSVTNKTLAKLFTYIHIMTFSVYLEKKNKLILLYKIS